MGNRQSSIGNRQLAIVKSRQVGKILDKGLLFDHDLISLRKQIVTSEYLASLLTIAAFAKAWAGKVRLTELPYN